MKNIWLLVGSLGLTFIIVVAVAFLFTKKANAPAVPVDSKLILSDTPNVKGPVGAKVTIVEFADFQCPACGAAQPLVDEIYKSATDSVKLVYRHFPLVSLHKNAFAAAEVAEAAGRQGKFWEMHDKLYATQADWAGDADPNVHFDVYAKDLGLQMDQWKKDLADKTIADRINKDEQDGNTLGVNATPTFYVNNLAVDVNDLKDSVDKLLKQ